MRPASQKIGSSKWPTLNDIRRAVNKSSVRAQKKELPGPSVPRPEPSSQGAKKHRPTKDAKDAFFRKLLLPDLARNTQSPHDSDLIRAAARVLEGKVLNADPKAARQHAEANKQLQKGMADIQFVPMDGPPKMSKLAQAGSTMSPGAQDMLKLIKDGVLVPADKS